ncbi:MAG: response regulator transcription factor [Verrucomicrobia bacterium]|nr:response regulator transcription factor [Verrucomicrobiota bacterium]
MSERIRIAIVDDHPALRIGLGAILNAQPDLRVIGEAGDVAEALAACERHQPDVVLMDLRLPGGGGAQATLAIRERWPAMRVLIVTTYDGDEDIHRALQAGASGYVLKDLTSTELVAAVRAVHRGEQVLPPAVAARQRERVRRKDLSPRELEVLQHLVNGLSNKEIARALSIGDESVKTHLSGIFLKLGVTDRTQAAIEAIRQGIVHLNHP